MKSGFIAQDRASDLAEKLDVRQGGTTTSDILKCLALSWSSDRHNNI
jgi:hypothetical protein